MPDNVKVFIVGSPLAFKKMFAQEGYEITNRMKEADFVQFTGGEDVTPRLYHQHPHPTTQNNIIRDKRECIQYHHAKKLGKPMAGICRGGQFLHVMNGGSLWQDVDGHGSVHGHLATDLSTGREIRVSSTHHQLMIEPTRVKSKILMTALEASRKSRCHRVNNHDKEPFTVVGTYQNTPDIEAIFYPGTKSLCFQPHPEMETFLMCRYMYFKYIRTYLLGGSK